MTMNTTYKYDHYFLYSELTDMMQSLSAQHSRVMQVTSMTQTLEGRNMWLATLTDPETGRPEEKPAVYLDANHHAGEVTSSIAIMHFLDYLATNSDTDDEVKDLLGKYTFYIIPRVSPDGAEHYLTTPDELRSVNRMYPESELQPGLQIADMDGDGCIRYMRVKTPYGCWKVNPDDPRLMIRRKPWETDGVFYNVYREGYIKDYDGVHIQPAKEKYSLDFNRSFPMNWHAEGAQAGAGPYPLSHPETKALVDFILTHKNIATAWSYHTAGGYIVCPPGFKVDKDVYDADMQRYKRRCELATELTGYVAMNLYKEFWPQDGTHSSWGTFVDWCHYAHGVPAMTMECWDLNVRAGVPNGYPMHNFVTFHDDERDERETPAVLKWIDENLGADTFKPWTEVDHPQLGKVEIGGVCHKYVTQNCPLKYLPEEAEKHTRFLLKDARVLPSVVIDSLQSEKVSEGVYRVRAVVGNHGYLPNYLTQQGLKLGLCHPVSVTLSGAQLVSGQSTVQIKQLEGFSGIKTGHIGFIGGLTTLKHAPCQEIVEWLVAGKSGDTVTVCCAGDTVGRARQTLVL